MSRPLPPRPNRQQIAAAATRSEVLTAARRLFAEGGYAGTSVAAIAEEAGVSVPTIYASIGPKQAIVMALVDLIDREVGAPEVVAQIATEADPGRLIALGAGLNRRLQERFGDILESFRSAAGVEPDVARAMAAGQQMHRSGAERLARRLESLGVLRPGLGVEEAADVIAFLTDVETFSTLAGRYGWTYDRAEAWVSTTVSTLLLG